MSRAGRPREPMNPTCADICALMSDGRERLQQEIAERLGITPRTTSEQLKRLCKMGILKRSTLAGFAAYRRSKGLAE